MLAIPFVVDSSNPSPTKGWSEDHINKTQAWYKSMASWARGHAEKQPHTQEPSIPLLEEWDNSIKGVDKVLKAFKVSCIDLGESCVEQLPLSSLACSCYALSGQATTTSTHQNCLFMPLT